MYGLFVEKIFNPDDRETPAVRMEDGIDYVPMSKWKNALINLLNIAGTGPIFGPIQGILFGPIAFITIPIKSIAKPVKKVAIVSHLPFPNIFYRAHSVLYFFSLYFFNNLSITVKHVFSFW